MNTECTAQQMEFQPLASRNTLYRMKLSAHDCRSGNRYKKISYDAHKAQVFLIELFLESFTKTLKEIVLARG